MNLLGMATLSLAVGLVAAGFVWFGWEAVENILARRAAASAEPEVTGEEGEEEEESAEEIEL